MLYDDIIMLENSTISNPTIASGITFPNSPNVGELFFRTDTQDLYVYGGAIWVALGSVTQLPRSTSFTGTTADCGKRIVISSSITISPNIFSAGNAFSLYNNSASGVTIAQGSGLTLRRDGTTDTGNRTLLNYGTCFVWFNSATEAIISGSLS